ncbi:hypothetical protein P5673_019172 [Acropora cervicornis]|uniref:Uncharacterized protein n=1 Tax=Acropora cervicornis TaxID=6130 RepID=A0AAD9QC43_ACRCE|nr:hypothetical protein P5673_019172 [Acropora cervicornis]
MELTRRSSGVKHNLLLTRDKETDKETVQEGRVEEKRVYTWKGRNHKAYDRSNGPNSDTVLVKKPIPGQLYVASNGCHCDNASWLKFSVNMLSPTA